jgi:proteic killer suppression protein
MLRFSDSSKVSVTVDRIIPQKWDSGKFFASCVMGLQCIEYRYIIKLMIKSFRDKDTQSLFEGRCPRRWQVIRRVAERKLMQLNAAATLDFLRAPPDNRLEALKGDRAGQFSIRINEQWRLCFSWAAGDVFDVKIVNYH